MALTYLSGERIQGSSSTGAVDTLGTTVNGTNAGANNSSETAIYGQTSVDFDGSNDRIDIDALGGVARTTGSFCFWLNPDTGGGYPLQISDANGNEYIKITSESTFVSTVQRDPAGANWEDNPGGTVAPHDKWTHIVLTQDGTTVKWYLDAVDQGTFTDNNDVNEWINADMDKFTIGAGWHYSRSQFEDFYNGQIQDVGFWNRALTSAEVTVLFNGFDKDSATSSSNTGKKVTDISQTGLLAYYTFNNVTTGITNSATATDEKTTISNVPVGTRYEETDTRKIFRRVIGKTFSQLSSDNNENLYAPTGSSRTEVGQSYQTGHVLVDKYVSKASWFLQRVGSTTGEIRAYIRKIDGTLIATGTYGGGTGLDASTLTTSYVEKTFDFPANTILNDYMLTVNSDELTSGQVDMDSLNADISNGVCYMKIGGVWSAITTAAIKMNVTYDSWVEKGTA